MFCSFCWASAETVIARGTALGEPQLLLSICLKLGGRRSAHYIK